MSRRNGSAHLSADWGYSYVVLGPHERAARHFIPAYNPNLNSTTGVVTDDILWNFFASHAKP